MTIFLAFVVFSELLTKPPEIVGGYRVFEDCVIDARKKNKELEDKNADSGSGFVCLVMTANV